MTYFNCLLLLVEEKPSEPISGNGMTKLMYACLVYIFLCEYIY